MDLRLTILGSNAAMPAHKRGLSAQVLQSEGACYLIDCGEGTQFAMQQFRIKPGRIDQIFISHLHGDHFFGLFGLLSSFNMQGRKNSITVFGPGGIRSVLELLEEVSGLYLSFDLNIVELNTSIYRKIFEDDQFRVYSIPLKHRVPTIGYKFVAKARQPNIRKEAIDEFKLTVEQIRHLKSGNIICTTDGIVLKPEQVSFRKTDSKSYAYISDSLFDPGIVQHIKGVDVLFHEATFMDDARELAAERMHSTARQAGEIAGMACAGILILGHFSSRYNDLNPLLEEARTVFPNAFLGMDGESFDF